MRASHTDYSTSSTWPVAGRPVEPYRIDPDVNDPESLSPQPKAYLRGPIHPWLLKLRPGDPQSFDTFVDGVGIGEFLEWTMTADLGVWVPLFERFRGDRSVFNWRELAKAWSHDQTFYAVRRELDVLREFYTFATEENVDIKAAEASVLAEGWSRGLFKIDLFVHDATGVLCERPRHLFARAWFELLDALYEGHRPRVCTFCSNPFIPDRSSQRYCKGTTCQQRAYDRRRSRKPKRREYQRDYQRDRRKKANTKRKDPGRGK
jgi:hypothetical protein